MGAHIINGKFQSDKYPTCPAGKVPLSVEDPTAQDLLWEYAQRRRAVDPEFADDLELALRTAGYTGAGVEVDGQGWCMLCKSNQCVCMVSIRVPHNEAVDIAIERTFGVKLPPK